MQEVESCCKTVPPLASTSFSIFFVVFCRFRLTSQLYCRKSNLLFLQKFAMLFKTMRA